MASPKLRRWTDLLVALLRRHYPVSLDDLIGEVPDYAGGYATGARESMRRKFERDKDELRAFGVPIETVRDEAGEVSGYRLSAKNFYLPYLSVMLDGSRTRPRRVARSGYQALTELTFEPDALAAVVEAARRVEALGDPVLTDAARSAMRKLAADLPLDAVAPRDTDTIVPPRTRADAAVFERLDDALARRKRATFDYHSMSADSTTRRTVEPLGLFYLGQHWYVAAREPGDDVVKNFRLSRIADVEVNGATPNSPDYEMPADFRLREHARSRQAWELGDGDALEVLVDFHGDTGAALAAARLGAAVEGRPERRRFLVRRLDSFARWLLPLGGAATAVAPAELVAEYRRQIDATLALYVSGEET